MEQGQNPGSGPHGACSLLSQPANFPVEAVYSATKTHTWIPRDYRKRRAESNADVATREIEGRCHESQDRGNEDVVALSGRFVLAEAWSLGILNAKRWHHCNSHSWNLFLVLRFEVKISPIIVCPLDRTFGAMVTGCVH
jgi:hypothetical protein